MSMPMEQQEHTDYMIGHCSVGLNRLCQTAAAAAMARQNNDKEPNSTDSEATKEDIVSTSVSVANILIRDGCPMYNIDKHSMQVCVLDTFYRIIYTSRRWFEMYVMIYCFNCTLLCMIYNVCTVCSARW